MTNINWTDGRLINLTQGDTAACTGGLNSNQIYALFFYNAAQNAASTNVSIVWSNNEAPVQVTVPGTTQNQGLAALCFVSGTDTNTVSAAVLNGQPGATIQAFIGSVKMPTNTAGITNRQLLMDGNVHAFNRLTRFYAVPKSHWYAGQITSDVNQFISVQFSESQAQVNIVNELVSPSHVIKYAGTSESCVTVNSVPSQTYSWSFQGDGQQRVWINADSAQNASSASISVQSLVGAMSAHETSLAGEY